MTPSELKYEVESHGKEPYFFTRETMQFFGDTMVNYGVRSTIIKVYDYDREYQDFIDGQPQVIELNVWELYRRHAVKHGLQSSAYFDKQTFERRHEAK
jgi:hypothetical protein